MLSLPAFVDGAEVRICARLRYRVDKESGLIVWRYDLYRWEEALRIRVANDFARAIKDTELPGYEGAPEA